MKLCYRQAAVKDIPVIFELSKDLIHTYEDLSAIDYEKVMKWVEMKITENISTYTVATRDSEACAYYRLCEDGELDDLYVLPNFRGQGIGTEILRKCIADSVAPLWLFVFTRNIRAIAFYERFGFTCRETVGNTRMILEQKG